MIKFILFTFIILGTTNAFSASVGERISVKELTPLNQLVQKADSFKGKVVLTNAKVENVCVKKGCWMGIKSGDNVIRVVFKDYGFFVPKEIVGKDVRLQGLFETKTISIKEQQHFLKDRAHFRT